MRVVATYSLVHSTEAPRDLQAEGPSPEHSQIPPSHLLSNIYPIYIPFAKHHCISTSTTTFFASSSFTGTARSEEETSPSSLPSLLNVHAFCKNPPSPSIRSIAGHWILYKLISSRSRHLPKSTTLLRLHLHTFCSGENPLLTRPFGRAQSTVTTTKHPRSNHLVPY